MVDVLVEDTVVCRTNLGSSLQGIDIDVYLCLGQQSRRHQGDRKNNLFHELRLLIGFLLLLIDGSYAS